MYYNSEGKLENNLQFAKKEGNWKSNLFTHVSYFDKENFNVIYREYVFSYQHWLIDLDMQVIVNMDYFNSKHIPTDIYYKGFWNVPFFKPERADFILKLKDYKVD